MNTTEIKLSEAMRRGRVPRRYTGGCWYPAGPILAAIVGAKLGDIHPDVCGEEEARSMLGQRWEREFAQIYSCPDCGQRYDLYSLLEHLTSDEHIHRYSRHKVVSVLEQLGL